MTKLERVMCVEDDPDIRMILDFSIRKVGGLGLCLCASGNEALEKFEAFQPQVLLLDVMMPGLSGPETFKKIQALPCAIGVPVVFLTAKAMQNEIDVLLACGAAGVIIKPFDPVALPANINIYWENRRG
jgi:CheY-like chemotaxis protein